MTARVRSKELSSLEVLHAVTVGLRKEMTGLTLPIAVPSDGPDDADEDADEDEGYWVAIPASVIRTVEGAERVFGFGSRVAELAHIQLSMLVLSKLAEKRP